MAGKARENLIWRRRSPLRSLSALVLALLLSLCRPGASAVYLVIGKPVQTTGDPLTNQTLNCTSPTHTAVLCYCSDTSVAQEALMGEPCGGTRLENSSQCSFVLSINGAIPSGKIMLPRMLCDDGIDAITNVTTGTADTSISSGAIYEKSACPQGYILGFVSCENLLGYCFNGRSQISINRNLTAFTFLPAVSIASNFTFKWACFPERPRFRGSDYYEYGYPSFVSDDSSSRVACPDGYFLENCTITSLYDLSIPRADLSVDGIEFNYNTEAPAFTNSNSAICTAYHGGPVGVSGANDFHPIVAKAWCRANPSNALALDLVAFATLGPNATSIVVCSERISACECQSVNNDCDIGVSLRMNRTSCTISTNDQVRSTVRVYYICVNESVASPSLAAPILPTPPSTDITTPSPIISPAPSPSDNCVSAAFDSTVICCNSVCSAQTIQINNAVNINQNLNVTGSVVILEGSAVKLTANLSVQGDLSVNISTLTLSSTSQTIVSGNLTVASGTINVDVALGNGNQQPPLSVSSCVTLDDRSQIVVTAEYTELDKNILVATFSCSTNLSTAKVSVKSTRPSPPCVTAVSQVNQSSLIVVFTNDPDCKSNDSPIPGLNMPGFIGLMVGLATALVIIILVIVILSVKKLRQRVFPYRDRKRSELNNVY